MSQKENVGPGDLRTKEKGSENGDWGGGGGEGVEVVEGEGGGGGGG